MSCLDHPEVKEAFERSNIPLAEWDQRAAQLDAVREQEGFNVAEIHEFSLVELHRKPDGSSMGSEEHLLGVVLGIGLVIVRDIGGMLRRRRVDSQFMVFSDAPGVTFYADDREHGRGWGHYSVQGVTRGGQAVVRISWPYSDRASDRREPSKALSERERILALLPQ